MGKAGRPSLTPVDRQCLKENKFCSLLSVDPDGRPLWISVLSGFSGRPARSTVRRFQPQIWLFIHCFSHFLLTQPASSFLPLFSKNPPNSKTLKFLQNSSWNHSLWVGSSVSGLPHQQISRISRSRVRVFSPTGKNHLFTLNLDI